MGKMTKYDMRARFSITWRKFKGEVGSFSKWFAFHSLLMSTVVLLSVGVAGLSYLPFFWLGLVEVGLVVACLVFFAAMAAGIIFYLEFSNVDSREIAKESERLRLRDENDVMNKDTRGALTQSRDGKSGGLTLKGDS